MTQYFNCCHFVQNSHSDNHSRIFCGLVLLHCDIYNCVAQLSSMSIIIECVFYVVVLFISVPLRSRLWPPCLVQLSKTKNLDSGLLERSGLGLRGSPHSF